MEFEIRKNDPDPVADGSGLSTTIRQMDRGDSIIVPSTLQRSVHGCAKSAGAKVKTRSNADGTVTVTRLDSSTNWKPVEPSRDLPTVEVKPSTQSKPTPTSKPAPTGRVVGTENIFSAGSSVLDRVTASTQLRPKSKPPTPTHTPDIDPNGKPYTSYTADDVRYFGHRHASFLQPQRTRAILAAHGCDSTADGCALPQPQLGALCAAFISDLVDALGAKWQPTLTSPIAGGPPATPTKPYSMEQLRAVFYHYVEEHSLDEARDILTPFNCDRSIAQAYYDLDAAQAHALVAKLGGLNPRPKLTIFD